MREIIPQLATTSLFLPRANNHQHIPPMCDKAGREQVIIHRQNVRTGGGPHDRNLSTRQRAK